MKKFLIAALVASASFVAVESASAKVVDITNHGRQRINVGDVNQSANGGRGGSCVGVVCRGGRGGNAGTNNLNVGNRSSGSGAGLIGVTNHGRQRIDVGNVSQSANGGRGGSCAGVVCAGGRGGNAGTNNVNIGNR
jgi:hypothetical protein